MASPDPVAPVPPGGAATVAQVLAQIDRAVGTRATQGSVPTGFGVLDHVLGGGLSRGDLVLVGGPPGVGKTVATLQWARNIARSGSPVTFVCYEHDERALFARLLQMELGTLAATNGSRGELRRLVRAVSRSERSIREAVAAQPHLKSAAAAVVGYQHRLWLSRGERTTDLDALAELAAGPDAPAALFVDYLQKVPAEGTGDVDARVASIAEGLKDLALRHDVAVVAVVAGDRDGLLERRLRLHHVRGSAGLAYEADVVVMLNDKHRVVSRAHTAFDPLAFERFRSQVVFTVEKHRDGLAGVDVEFTKDFEHYRFDPDGDAVDERLIDDHFYVS